MRSGREITTTYDPQTQNEDDLPCCNCDVVRKLRARCKELELRCKELEQQVNKWRTDYFQATGGPRYGIHSDEPF
jgi:hypothetical protein